MTPEVMFANARRTVEELLPEWEVRFVGTEFDWRGGLKGYAKPGVELSELTRLKERAKQTLAVSVRRLMASKEYCEMFILVSFRFATEYAASLFFHVYPLNVFHAPRCPELLKSA